MDGIVGVYDAKTDALLERVERSGLAKALADWKKLGYETFTGPAFTNLIILHEGKTNDGQWS